MIILSIETSCDETAVSVVEAEGPVDTPVFRLLGNALVSQMKLHAEYGGVYPNLAKREHIKNLPHVLATALKEAGLISNLKFPIYKEDLGGKIDAIAVTVGPGLEPALWTGINFAQDLSKKWNVPLIPTNHMEGHIASVLLESKPKVTFGGKLPRVTLGFPAVALLISGGHTELVYLKSWQEKEIVGETKDDAVGEAFDKVARMLFLPYPGGPEISRLASQARELGIKNYELRLPRPMMHSRDLNFSFSGLKTAVLYYLRGITHPNPSLTIKRGVKNPDTRPLPLLNKERPRRSPGEVPDKLKLSVASEFEDAVVEVLLSKSRQAILRFNPKTFIVAGGVIANKKIRESFEKLKEEFSDLVLRIPEKDLATDNAVMIAVAGYLSYISSTHSKIDLKAKGNLKYS